MDVFGALIRRIEQLESQINQLDRRQNNTVREATVTEVFPDEGTVRVNAHGLESKKVPWLQRSGSIREWTPPEVGERVVMLSPTGEPGQGMILPGGYSDKYPQPHNKAGEKRVSIGTVHVTHSHDGIFIQAGDVIMEITTSGIRINGSFVSIVGGTGQTTIEGGTHFVGGSLAHNGKNIGDTHRHLGVEFGRLNQ